MKVNLARTLDMKDREEMTIEAKRVEARNDGQE